VNAPLSERYPASPSAPAGRTWLWRRLPGERPAHRATTANVQAAYPFMADGGLGPHGSYVGADAYGGSFVYDPWALYGRWLTNPNMVVIGQLGKGKSALIKSLLYRGLVFGRRGWVIDPKGEYAPLAEALGLRPIRLRPGGEVRLNPLTRRGGEPAQQALLRAITAAALGRPLRPEEEAGLREALRVLNGRPHGEPRLPDVVDLLLRPREEMAAALATEREPLAAAVREAALATQRLCEGDLRGMFDAETTSGLDLEAPLVIIDLSELYDSAALGILMTCAAAWQRAQIAELRRRAEADREPGTRIVNCLDEGWRLLGHLGSALWLQDSFKHARAYGVQNILVLHRLSDLRSAGARESREVRLAEGLVSDTETRVIYAQPADQAELLRDVLALTETQLELVTGLGQGEALWQVGERSFLVQHRLSSHERRLIDTDARMRAVRAVAP
jgi:type IV secretory pathway VirB4 component